MASYRVDPGRTRIAVRARSSIHDTTTTWSRVTGRIEADPDALAERGATALFTVDMTVFDAGDWLKNRKLKKDLALSAHPEATFELTGLREVVREQDGRFRAVGDGTLRWRGRALAIAIEGSGRLTGDGEGASGRIEAFGRFELDIRDLGVEPPRFLMFKVESQVLVEVTVVATAGPG